MHTFYLLQVNNIIYLRLLYTYLCHVLCWFVVYVHDIVCVRLIMSMSYKFFLMSAILISTGYHQLMVVIVWTIHDYQGDTTSKA